MAEETLGSVDFDASALLNTFNQIERGAEKTNKSFTVLEGKLKNLGDRKQDRSKKEIASLIIELDKLRVSASGAFTAMKATGNSPLGNSAQDIEKMKQALIQTEKAAKTMNSQIGKGKKGNISTAVGTIRKANSELINSYTALESKARVSINTNNAQVDSNNRLADSVRKIAEAQKAERAAAKEKQDKRRQDAKIKRQTKLQDTQRRKAYDASPIGVFSNVSNDANKASLSIDKVQKSLEKFVSRGTSSKQNTSVAGISKQYEKLKEKILQTHKVLEESAKSKGPMGAKKDILDLRETLKKADTAAQALSKNLNSTKSTRINVELKKTKKSTDELTASLQKYVKTVEARKSAEDHIRNIAKDFIQKDDRRVQGAREQQIKLQAEDKRIKNAMATADGKVIQYKRAQAVARANAQLRVQYGLDNKIAIQARRTNSAFKRRQASLIGNHTMLKRIYSTAMGLATSRFLYGMVSQLRAALAEAKKFDKALGEIQTISQDSPQRDHTWSSNIRGLSEQYGSGIGDIAEGTYQTLSNQVAKGAEVTTFMSEAMRFATASVSSTTDSVNLLSSVLKSYNMTSERTSEISAITFKTIELGRVRASEMANTIGKITPLSAQLGISYKELSAMIATLTQKGIKFNVAGTQIRGMMLKMVKPTKQMTVLLKDWGYETFEQATKAEGFSKIMKRISKDIAESGRGSARTAELFSRARAISGFSALDHGAYEGVLSQFENTTETYAQAVGQQFERVSKKLDIEMEKIKNVFTFEYATPFLNQLVDVNEGVGGFANKLKESMTYIVGSFAGLSTIGALRMGGMDLSQLGKMNVGFKQIGSSLRMSNHRMAAFHRLVGRQPGLFDKVGHAGKKAYSGIASSGFTAGIAITAITVSIASMFDTMRRWRVVEDFWANLNSVDIDTVFADKIGAINRKFNELDKTLKKQSASDDYRKMLKAIGFDIADLDEEISQLLKRVEKGSKIFNKSMSVYSGSVTKHLGNLKKTLGDIRTKINESLTVSFKIKTDGNENLYDSIIDSIDKIDPAWEKARQALASYRSEMAQFGNVQIDTTFEKKLDFYEARMSSLKEMANQAFAGNDQGRARKYFEDLINLNLKGRQFGMSYNEILKKQSEIRNQQLQMEKAYRVELRKKKDIVLAEEKKAQDALIKINSLEAERLELVKKLSDTPLKTSKGEEIEGAAESRDKITKRIIAVELSKGDATKNLDFDMSARIKEQMNLRNGIVEGLDKEFNENFDKEKPFRNKVEKHQIAVAGYLADLKKLLQAQEEKKIIESDKKKYTEGLQKADKINEKRSQINQMRRTGELQETQSSAQIGQELLDLLNTQKFDLNQGYVDQLIKLSSSRGNSERSTREFFTGRSQTSKVDAMMTGLGQAFTGNLDLLKDQSNLDILKGVGVDANQILSDMAKGKGLTEINRQGEKVDTRLGKDFKDLIKVIGQIDNFSEGTGIGTAETEMAFKKANIRATALVSSRDAAITRNSSNLEDATSALKDLEIAFTKFNKINSSELSRANIRIDMETAKKSGKSQENATANIMDRKVNGKRHNFNDIQEIGNKVYKKETEIIAKDVEIVKPIVKIEKIIIPKVNTTSNTTSNTQVSKTTQVVTKDPAVVEAVKESTKVILSGNKQANKLGTKTVATLRLGIDNRAKALTKREDGPKQSALDWSMQNIKFSERASETRRKAGWDAKYKSLMPGLTASEVKAKEISKKKKSDQRYRDDQGNRRLLSNVGQAKYDDIKMKEARKKREDDWSNSAAGRGNKAKREQLRELKKAKEKRKEETQARKKAAEEARVKALTPTQLKEEAQAKANAKAKAEEILAKRRKSQVEIKDDQGKGTGIYRKKTADELRVEKMRKDMDISGKNFMKDKAAGKTQVAYTGDRNQKALDQVTSEMKNWKPEIKVSVDKTGIIKVIDKGLKQKKKINKGA